MQEFFDGALSDYDLANIVHDWPLWARPDQLSPDGNWTHWLMLGGRGSGKTRAGAEWIISQMIGTTPLGHGKCFRGALVGETAADVRDVMIEGDSGIMSCIHPDYRPTYYQAKRRLVFPNGAQLGMYNSTAPELLRGPQHGCYWADELAKWVYLDDAWSNLMFGLRMGTHPRGVITTTPRPIKLLKDLISDTKTCVTTRVSTYANRLNLAPSFFTEILKKYEGTRLGRQEIDAEILNDNPNALFSRQNIDSNRLAWPDEELMEVVVAVDPPVTSNKNSDECGIIVAAKGATNGRGFILGDHTIQGVSPASWARKAVLVAEEHGASCIVAEVNQGGELVAMAINKAAEDEGVAKIPVVQVRASKGKFIRAEPIALLYEQNKISHCGCYSRLEDQMCEFDREFDPAKAGYSPDRLDALVWALTRLFGKEVVEPRIRKI